MPLGTKSQVTKGAKFLDEKVPGWFEKINIKKLVMDSNTMCILGQLAGQEGYKSKTRALAYGEEYLDLTEVQFGAFGFESEGSKDSKDEVKEHGELWIAEINKRLEKTASKKTVNK